MRGIDLNQPVQYRNASMRYFEKKEYHVTRYCRYNVLLLVFEGILRFTEDGVPYEVGPGEYHIQKANTFQSSSDPSDAPKYLYIHFFAQWAEEGSVLPFRGNFDYHSLESAMKNMDQLAHGPYTYVEQASEFFEILSLLYRGNPTVEKTPAHQIAEFLSEEYQNDITLEQLSETFHFSKNQIINIFKAEYGITPFVFLNEKRLQHAEYQLIVTSDPIEKISDSSGFHTYSQFYKLFVRKHKVSPWKWRNLKRNW